MKTLFKLTRKILKTLESMLINSKKPSKYDIKNKISTKLKLLPPLIIPLLKVLKPKLKKVYQNQFMILIYRNINKNYSYMLA